MPGETGVGGEGEFCAWVSRSLKASPDPPIEGIISHLLEKWDIVGESGATYRFLGALFASIDGEGDDKAADRVNFARVLQSVCEEWSAQDAEEEACNHKRYADSSSMRIDMSAGAVAVFPRDWLIANPADAIKSTNAWVVEVKNPLDPDTPRIVVFNNADQNELSNAERAHAIKLAIAAWPRLEDNRKAEVELAYGPDGGITNMDEYAAAPLIGVFSLYDSGQCPLGEPPYGSYIDRRDAGQIGS